MAKAYLGPFQAFLTKINKKKKKLEPQLKLEINIGFFKLRVLLREIFYKAIKYTNTIILFYIITLFQIYCQLNQFINSCTCNLFNLIKFSNWNFF